jgi:threonine dehydratase
MNRTGKRRGLPDEQIRREMVLWDLPIVSESRGATAFATLVSGAYVRSPGEKTAAALCGGYADPASFAQGASRQHRLLAIRRWVSGRLCHVDF